MKTCIALFLAMLILTGCGVQRVSAPTEEPTEYTHPHTLTGGTLPPETEETQPEVTLPAAPDTIPLREGISTQEALDSFREVCMAAEFPGAGVDYTLLHRWERPVIYRIASDCTPEDLATVEKFAQWLNALPGFPGMYPEAENSGEANLLLFFWDQEALDAYTREQSGITGCEGYTTVWYDDENLAVDHGTIYLLSSMAQEDRESVILEEIYNTLGPLQDTVFREDSIIYQLTAEEPARWLSPMDELILELLYRPELVSGDPWDTCETLIRQVYPDTE